MKLPLVYMLAALAWPVHASTLASDPRVLDHIQSMNAYADRTHQTRPVVAEYKYGSSLDIKNVVGFTEEVKSCKPIAMAMTYVDGENALRTVIFKNVGSCYK
ncbi:DUF2790 domain-containing protein [Pseudomonas sp. NPDC089752]|uniref:DUF2790 domain-containing protein n=1 Tax=Pseudomonas sp. NPDC089752 TaxID=3364472 RepID=UPI003818851E